MKHVKLFEGFLNESEVKDEFSIIMHDWNLYLVPTTSLETRPKSDSYVNPKGFTSSDYVADAKASANNRWISRIEHYYIMPELLAEWECKSGRACVKKPEQIVKDVNFKIITTDTIQHVKIASGAPTKELKNTKVAVPINYPVD